MATQPLIDPPILLFHAEKHAGDDYNQRIVLDEGRFGEFIDQKQNGGNHYDSEGKKISPKH